MLDHGSLAATCSSSVVANHERHGHVGTCSSSGISCHGHHGKFRIVSAKFEKGPFISADFGIGSEAVLTIGLVSGGFRKGAKALWSDMCLVEHFRSEEESREGEDGEREERVHDYGVVLILNILGIVVVVLRC